MAGPYAEAYARSLADPEGFWADAAAGIDWLRHWDTVLDRQDPTRQRWFVGGRMNTCWNALDRHVAAGRGDQAALIHESPVTDSRTVYTYRQLLDQVALCAGYIAGLGVGKGDRVVLYMPMIPEAAIAMLACARLGAIHSVVFGGFAAHELATRLNDAKPRLVISASCGVEPSRLVAYKPLLDAAIEAATHKPEHCLIVQRPQLAADMVAGRDHEWRAIDTATPHPGVPVDATDPLYILYTSGTTGQPKGVVRDNGGHAVALKWSMEHFYGLKPGEVFWAASDVGWVVGHSYIVYGPLLQGATTVLYEGKPVGTPDAAAYWRVIARNKVSMLFTAPTAFRAIKREDPQGLLLQDYDLSSLRLLFLAGERSDSDTVKWAQTHLKVPVIDNWWQTETGWPIAGNQPGLELMPIKYGSVSRAVPGWDVRVLDGAGREMARGDVGAIVVRLPLPPGALTTLWNAHERFVRAYLADHPGYYQTSDAGFVDEDGYIHIMARTDDIINVAGHRLSTGAMEEVLATHPDIAECAVIGAYDSLKGQVPVGLLVLKVGVARSHGEIAADVVARVRDLIGPVAAFRHAVVVDRLPKTRSGKILRGTMQKIADGQPWTMPATIDDPAILDEITQALAHAGFAQAPGGPPPA